MPDFQGNPIWNDHFFGALRGNHPKKRLSPTELLVPFGRWQSTSHSFQTYSFPRIWDLVLQRDDQGLSELVHEKVVILFPVGNSDDAGRPLWSRQRSTGFLHATLFKLNSHNPGSRNPFASCGRLSMTLAFSLMMAHGCPYSCSGRQTWVFVGLPNHWGMWVSLRYRFSMPGSRYGRSWHRWSLFTMTSAGRLDCGWCIKVESERLITFRM